MKFLWFSIFSSKISRNGQKGQVFSYFIYVVLCLVLQSSMLTFDFERVSGISLGFQVWCLVCLPRGSTWCQLAPLGSLLANPHILSKTRQRLFCSKRTMKETNCGGIKLNVKNVERNWKWLSQTALKNTWEASDFCQVDNLESQISWLSLGRCHW